MAGETFYFFLSTIALLGVLLFIGSTLFFRFTGKTILGEEIKPGMPAYKNMKELTGNRNLVIAIIFSLIFTANLAYDISRVLKMDNPDYRNFLFIVAPAVTIVAFGLILRDARHKFGNKKPRR